MLGSYVRRTPFSRSAAMTVEGACPPYAAAHHERRFDGNKRVSIKKPLIMSGFAGGRPFQAAENWPCFALSHSATCSAKGVATTRAKGQEKNMPCHSVAKPPRINGGQGRQYPARNSCIAKRTREHGSNCPEFNARRDEDFHRTQAANWGRPPGPQPISNLSLDAKIAKRPHRTAQMRFERSKSVPQWGATPKNCAADPPVSPQSERDRSNPRLVRNPKSQAPL